MTVQMPTALLKNNTLSVPTGQVSLTLPDEISTDEIYQARQFVELVFDGATRRARNREKEHAPPVPAHQFRENQDLDL